MSHNFFLASLLGQIWLNSGQIQQDASRISKMFVSIETYQIAYNF